MTAIYQALFQALSILQGYNQAPALIEIIFQNTETGNKQVNKINSNTDEENKAG